MKMHEIKIKYSGGGYSILIGKNILSLLYKKINLLCPKARKIVFVVDKNVPSKFKKTIEKNLKRYDLFFFFFNASEKTKSFKSVNYFLNKIFQKNLNRSDLIVSVGGGITGDVVGFVASIYKRGIDYINIPSTLLAQVDSAIGGKTGVNSNYGKNLIGSFNQPKLVICDTSFISTLPKKEMICGFAEILKHSIIKDKNFFNWLKKNSKYVFLKKKKELIYSIKKSCQIKTYFVERDTNEKGLRMILNFGHTFAHAIEVKNNYAKNISHGEAVLSGIILASRLSYKKNVCNLNTVREITDIFYDNNLAYTFKKFYNEKSIKNLIPYLKNDKKNNDNKINFILLKKIGTTTSPNRNKITEKNLKKMVKGLINSNF